jgi:hypothetical protein
MLHFLLLGEESAGMGSDGRGATGYYWEAMVGTTVWMMVTDRIGGGHGQAGGRSLTCLGG